MTAQERLVAYLELRASGYSASETKRVISEIKEKMEKEATTSETT